MSNEQDPFSDIRGSLGNASGMFGSSEALSHHDQVSGTIDRGGYQLKFSCDHCGSRVVLGISWDEMATVSYRAIPAQWKLINGHLVPNVHCPTPSCREELYPGLTPNECASKVQEAIRQGFYPAQRAQQIGQIAAQQQQAMAGQMRR